MTAQVVGCRGEAPALLPCVGGPPRQALPEHLRGSGEHCEAGCPGAPKPGQPAIDLQQLSIWDNDGVDVVVSIQHALKPPTQVSLQFHCSSSQVEITMLL